MHATSLRPTLWRLALLWGPILSASAAAVEGSPAFDYRMNCEGCHAIDGVGAEPHVPALTANLAPFLQTALGREYLVRVPGVRQASISNARVANLLNYVVTRFGDPSNASNFAPITEAEVARYRERPYLNVPAARQAALDAQAANTAATSPGTP